MNVEVTRVAFEKKAITLNETFFQTPLSFTLKERTKEHEVEFPKYLLA